MEFSHNRRIIIPLVALILTLNAKKKGPACAGPLSFETQFGYWQTVPKAPRNCNKSAVVTEPSWFKSAGQGFCRLKVQEPSSVPALGS